MESDQGPGLPILSSHQFEDDVKYPLKIDIAFDVVRWANSLESGMRSPHLEKEGRDLSPTEKVVYNSGLEVLRLYLTGEMDFNEEIHNEVRPESKEASEAVDVKTPNTHSNGDK